MKDPYLTRTNLGPRCAVCQRPVWGRKALMEHDGLLVQMKSDHKYLIGCTTDCVIKLASASEKFDHVEPRYFSNNPGNAVDPWSAR